MQYLQHKNRFIRHVAAGLFIYPVFIPLLLLDISMEIYHQVCFRLFRLPLNKRSKYFKIDRHRLQYLDPLQKLNCLYCSYANGLMAYMSKIAADTEKYWCGIKHKQEVADEFLEPAHHKDFLPYGDEQAFKEFKKERA